MATTRTVSFQIVMNGIIARMGLDPTVSPTASLLAAYTEYINSGVRTCWETYAWPDLMNVENRAFYPAWAAGTTYAANAVVLGSDNNYYYSKIASNVAHDPVADLTDAYWALTSAYPSTTSSIVFAIPINQTINGVTQTPIGRVVDVYASDPRTNRYAQRLNWWLGSEGIVIGQTGGTVPASVWVQFLSQPTVYTVGSYTNSDSIPYVIAEAVKYLGCAAAQREDGQFDKANVHDKLALDYLNLEYQRIQYQQTGGVDFSKQPFTTASQALSGAGQAVSQFHPGWTPAQ
jgi:hypothetical protein